MKGIIKKVFGIKARFCNKGCGNSFKCDREHGLVYPAIRTDNGGERKFVSREQYSISAGFCCYCNTDLRS